MKRLHLIIIIALLSALTATAKKQKQLVILHTNDTHSTILPLNPNLDDKEIAGRGGFMRRVSGFLLIGTGTKVLMVDAVTTQVLVTIINVSSTLEGVCT